jgi:hypothetical protein
VMQLHDPGADVRLERRVVVREIRKRVVSHGLSLRAGPIQPPGA